ncbi:hypothetical protein FPOAC2_12541 [Fusarium poae]|jgi:hypothetical protein
MHEAKTVMREGPKHNNGFIEGPRIAVESPAACWLLSVELKLEKGKILRRKGKNKKKSGFICIREEFFRFTGSILDLQSVYILPFSLVQFRAGGEEMMQHVDEVFAAQLEPFALEFTRLMTREFNVQC